MIRMGPMIQQMQSACPSCKGRGKTFVSSRKPELISVVVAKGDEWGRRVVKLSERRNFS